VFTLGQFISLAWRNAAVRPSPRVVGTPRAATPAVTDVRLHPAEAEEFWTHDGVRLALTRRRGRAESGQKGRRVIVLVPGLFTSRECPEHQALAERLTEIADVVSVDVRGHGESGGVFTWGQREYNDVAALAASLRGTYERVGAVGFSFGGYHVGAAAAAHRSFDAVAMVATPRSFSPFDRHFLLRGIRRSLGAARRRTSYARRFSLASFCRSRPPATAFVHAITPTPLLIAHGTGDWLLGTHHAHDLYTRAVEPKSLVLVEGAPHAEGMMVAYAEALVPPLLRFLDNVL
jgi:fermentation-respiration switch protein FrsA (DUF1100 family)